MIADGVTPADGGRHRVFVLGAGRAGRALATALVAGGATLVGLHARRPSPPAPPLPAPSVGALPPSLREASVVLVTVRDAQLDDAIGELAAASEVGALAPNAVVLHASGATAPAALDALRARGHPAGTLHPLLPLHDVARATAQLRGAWIGVDGDDAARATGRALAALLGARTLDIPAGAKARYHAAAVVASNFPVVLAALAARLLREAGVSAEEADGAVRALLAGASANVAARRLDAAAMAEVLTGPVTRGDVASVRRHLESLAGDDSASDVYGALTRAAVELLRAAGRDDAASRAIAAIVSRDR